MSSQLIPLTATILAIIVFEDAFHLRQEDLEQATNATVRLVTIGALISLSGQRWPSASNWARPGGCPSSSGRC